MSPEERLERAGVPQAEADEPVATYVMAVRTGLLLFLFGHGAFDGGTATHTSRLGEGLSTEEGRRLRVAGTPAAAGTSKPTGSSVVERSLSRRMIGQAPCDQFEITV